MTAIVLAAGRGARFAAAAPGAPAKLLTPIEGIPLLSRTLAALKAGGVTRLLVVIAPDAGVALPALCADAGATLVVNSDPERGMLSSVRSGLAAVTGDPGAVCLVTPGDIPFVRPETVAAVVKLARETGRSVSPRLAGRGGHPVAVSARLRDAILGAADTCTLRDLLEADDPVRLIVDDPGILHDVDLPGDASPPPTTIIR